MNRKEKLRTEGALLFISGAWNTFDSWTKVLLPFMMWGLDPRPDFMDVTQIYALGGVFTLIGTFIIAYSIEAHGLRRSAIACVAVSVLYQFLICRVKNYYIFYAIQGLLLFNHMPMIVDSCVAYMEGEDGDDKKRTRFLNRLTIPMSIGIAAGPYIALQVLFFLTSSLDFSQTMCAVFHVLCLLPAVFAIPDNYKASKTSAIESYVAIIFHERIRWCLLLLVMVLAPYASYDQVIRIILTGTVIQNPQQLVRLFVVLGGTTVVVNLLLLPFLQKKYGPREILSGAFGLLTASYVFLAHTTEYNSLLFGMPLQVIGVSLCLGELPSQIIACAGKSNCGKTAALIRMAHLLGYFMTPIITGMSVENAEATILCYVCAVISLAAIPILYKFCGFMRAHSILLPGVDKFD